MSKIYKSEYLEAANKVLTKEVESLKEETKLSES